MNEALCGRRIIHHDRLEAARRLMRSYPDIEQMNLIFKTIADPGRLLIVIALSSQEMCVCDLAAFIGVSESAASHQLRVLRTMNLVKSKRDGQVLYYRLVDDHVIELVRIAGEHARELRNGARYDE